MTTDNRTNEPSEAQVEAAARKWIERLDSDAHWARSPGAREKASSEKNILEWLLEAAAGVAPPAPSEYAYCPIHGDLLAANRSYRCGNAPTGHEYSRHTIPLYGMLDLWMALYGTSHPQFDEFYEKHGYAETWARLLAEVRSRTAAGVAPQAESETAEEFDLEWAQDYALRYWQFGGEPKTQRALTLLINAPVQPSSTVDEAALIREAKAEALEEASLAYGSGQLSGIFLGRDDYPKAWLRARADEYREGSET